MAAPRIEDVRGLESHPRLPELMAHTPPGPDAEPPGSRVLGLVIAASALGAAGLTTLAFGLTCPPMMLLPIALVVFLVYAGADGLRKSRAERAALARYPAGIVEVETTFRGATGESPAGTQHLVELLFADGVRRSFHASSELASRLSSGELGVSYVRGSSLVEFARLEA